MTGFFGDDAWAIAATWVAALATLAVLAAMFGERRIFGWTQHLMAGLVTGFLALVVLREVLGPRLVEPLAAQPDRAELWLGAALVAVTAGAPWLPRVAAAVPLSIAIGALAAFALGGAVIGTILPQLRVAIAGGEGSTTETAVAIGSAAVTALVLLAFLRGAPRGRVVAGAAGAGRWLLVGGLGAWLGYLLLSRLVLLLDRIAFLLGEWLGLFR